MQGLDICRSGIVKHCKVSIKYWNLQIIGVVSTNIVAICKKRA